ncbi:MAG TPA: pyruvate kinase [Pontiellaceae bacterium]|nr:pyruvate kinase [Pontiellaceae bacterium]HPR83447.1 pyruvate kinase [Pontiellaceae bacterium]
MRNKQTKIICTLALDRCGSDFIKQLVDNGMDVVRLNSAHLDIAGAEQIVANIRAVSDRVGILLDTKGPEVRTCNVEKTLFLKAGDTVEIGVNRVPENGFQVSYSGFADEVPTGSRVLIDDGLIALSVEKKTADTLICTALNDGEIKNKKGVNVPGIKLDLPALTEKDAEFIDWATRNEIDFIAHSFVRCREDILAIQGILDLRRSPIKIIAKIENREGVDNLESILDVAHGIMVARGDLGIEIPAEEVPGVQKEMIKTCIRRIKPVITATQMLESMVNNPRPTRAEVSDVANAIYDGTDAIMLSGETAYGKFPVEAVQMMSKVARTVESQKESLLEVIPVHQQNAEVMPRNHLAKAAVACAAALPVKAIITSTNAGITARICASYRGRSPILALSEKMSTVRQLSLSYGVYSSKIDMPVTTDELVKVCLLKMIEEKKIAQDDLIVFIGGGHQNEAQHTNMILIETPAVLLKQ